jgi:hypothetical protein
MRCLPAHRDDVCLPIPKTETAGVNSVSSPGKLRSITTHRLLISPHPHQFTPDFDQARNKPIPITFAQRLPASSCIRNAPAIRPFLVLQLTWPAHCRYNSDDFLSSGQELVDATACGRPTLEAGQVPVGASSDESHR